MSVETDIRYEGDLEAVLALLVRQSEEYDGPMREIAAYMLRSYAEDHYFPSVRATASSTHGKHGTTQRSQRDLILAWRRELSAVGLHP